MTKKMFGAGADELKEAVIQRLSAAGPARREAGIAAGCCPREPGFGDVPGGRRRNLGSLGNSPKIEPVR